MTADETYLAYGKQRDSGKVVTDNRFTGQKEDGSGLMYYGARYYDPQIGLFVSPDTIVPDAGNLFSYNRSMYVYGNPLKSNDPTGHVVNIVYDPRANQINVTASIEVYDHHGTMAAADLAAIATAWEGAIENAWNDDGRGNNFTYGGVPVVFDVDVFVGNDACAVGDNCVAAIAPDAAGNYDFSGTDCEGFGGVSCAGNLDEIGDFNRGERDTLDSGAWAVDIGQPVVAAHEFGHYAGLTDDYSNFAPRGRPLHGHGGPPVHMMASDGRGEVVQHEINDMMPRNVLPRRRRGPQPE